MQNRHLKMPRDSVRAHLASIDEMYREIEERVPENQLYNIIQFRADLAGLLVVAIAARYESCVKEIIYDHTERRHESFGAYARRNYSRINSKISIRDLKKYCEIFEPAVKTKFTSLLTSRRQWVSARVGKNIENCYERILELRHDFAHTGNRNTTLTEAFQTHRLAKHVIFSFDDAFAAS